MGHRLNDNKNHMAKGCYCNYCHKWIGRLERHLISVHSTEIGVRRLMAIEDKEEKNAEVAKMRNLGNHHHNCQVLEKRSGQIVVKRGPADVENADYTKYLPCSLCHVWYSSVQYYRHCCPQADGENKPSRKRSKEIVTGADAGITEAMARVLSCLANDEIGNTVRNDFLLREYIRFQTESELYRQKKVRDQLRIKLRYGARLLLQLRKDFPHSTLLELLTKDNFDNIVDAARACCVGDGGKVFFETGIKIGHFLTELIARADVMAIKANDFEKQNDLALLLKRKRYDWTVRIVKGAKYLITQRLTNQVINLPTTADVVKFSTGLTKLLEKAVDSYRNNPTQATYRHLQKILLVKIITFNRKGY